MKIHKTCSCGRSFTYSEWQTLPFVGIQSFDFDPDGSNEDGSELQEVRNCPPPCNSTLQIRIATSNTALNLLRRALVEHLLMQDALRATQAWCSELQESEAAERSGGAKKLIASGFDAIHWRMTPRYLFWCDLETTGLHADQDDILELSYILTDFVFPYTLAAVRMPEQTYLVRGRGRTALLEGNCSSFIVDMHQKSGLLEALKVEGAGTAVGLSTIEADLLALSEGWPTDKDERVMIAGNSAHFDLAFLRAKLPAFAARLSHRVFDASGVYRFALSIGMPPLPKHEEAHRASVDVRRSIDLALECARWCS